MLKRLLKRLLPARPPRPGLELADGTLAAPGTVPLNADLVDVSTLMPCTCGMEGVPDGWRHHWPTDSIGWLKADPGCPRYRPLADELAVREQLRVAARAEEAAGVVAGPAATAYRQHMDRLLGREGLGLPAHSEVAVLPARVPPKGGTGVVRAPPPTRPTPVPEGAARLASGAAEPSEAAVLPAWVPPNVGVLVVRPWLSAGPVVGGQTAEEAERLKQRLDAMDSSKSLMRSLVLGSDAKCTAAPAQVERQPMRPTYDPSLQDSILK